MSGVGERIYKLRKELGITQEELAQKLGYKSKSSINKIEMGKSEVPQKKIGEFANALDTTPGYILGLADEESAKMNAVLSAAIKELKSKPVDEIAAMKDNYEIRSFTKKFAKLSPYERTTILQLMDVFLLR